MKENRKLLKEVLKDIRRDMTDEEVLNLLADSKISVSPESGTEKYTLGQRAADSGCHCQICRKLGVYFLVYRRLGAVDGHKHGAGCTGVRSVSVYFAESGAVLHCSDPGAAHHDEPEPSGGKGSPQSGKRL